MPDLGSVSHPWRDDENIIPNNTNNNAALLGQSSIQISLFNNGVNDTTDSLFFNDDLFWSMEAGMGEYAYGDPSLSFSLFPEFDHTGNL